MMLIPKVIATKGREEIVLLLEAVCYCRSTPPIWMVIGCPSAMPQEVESNVHASKATGMQGEEQVIACVWVVIACVGHDRQLVISSFIHFMPPNAFIVD